MPHSHSLLVVRLITLICCLVPTLLAAQSGMVVNVVEEFGGMYRPGRWYPVVVSIDNRLTDSGNPESFQGTLSIQSPTYGDRNPMVEFSREVNVPPSSNQRYILLTRIRSGMTERVLEVRSEGGRLVQRVPLNLTSVPNGKILLVTAQTQPRRVSYPAPRISSANPYIMAVMATSNLPDHWAAYDSVDVLSFPAWPESPVSSVQANALIEWVSMGGTLAFLGGGSTASYAGAGASPLLPVDVGSSTSYRFDRAAGVLVPHSPTGGAASGNRNPDDRSFLVTELGARPGSEVVLSIPDADGNEVALLVRRRMGNGRVVFSALDFDVLPDGLRAYVDEAWISNMPLPDALPSEETFHRLLGEAAPPPTRRAAQPPNLLLVLLIAITYVVVVGPLNFIVLARKGHIQWAWFTVPAIVIVFSSMIYTLGTWSKGTRTVVRETSLIWGVQDDPSFSQRSFISAFTHRPANATVEPLDPAHATSDAEAWSAPNPLYQSGSFMAMAGRQATTGLGLSSSVPQVVQVGTNPAMRSWRMRTYDIAAFESRGPRDLAGPLNSTLVYRSSGQEFWLVGTIRNNTGLDFSRSFLLWGRGALVFEEPLATGESMDLNRSNSVRELGGVTRPWETRSAALASLTPRDVEEDSPSDYHLRASRVLLESLFLPPVYSTVLPPHSGKLLFVGMVDHEEPSFVTNINAGMLTRSSIVVVELNPAPRPGETFDIPGDLVHIALQEFSRDGGMFQWGGFGGRNIEELTMRDSAGMFNVRLPFEAPDIRISDARVVVDAPATSTRQKPIPRLYSVERGAFMPFGESGTARVANAGIFQGSNATGWMELVATDPDAEEGRSPTFSVGMTEELRVRRLELWLRGQRMP